MQAPPITDISRSSTSDTPGSRSITITPAFIQALSAARPLHQKQVQLLAFLTAHRHPHTPEQTLPLSYAKIHHGTGVSIDHIRRNGLQGLFRSGLLSVVSQTFAGTIYRLTFDQATTEALITHLQVTSAGSGSSRAPHPGPMPQDTMPSFQTIEAHLILLQQIHEQSQELVRQEFLSHLTPGQRQWLAAHAKRTVDAQHDIRILGHRVPHYEAQRRALIDEWISRQRYGEDVPSHGSQIE